MKKRMERILLLVAAMILLAGVANYTTTGYASSYSSSNPSGSCTIGSLEAEQSRLQYGLNSVQAVTLSQTSSAFRNSNASLNFNSIFSTWSVNVAACSVRWDTVNVVYSMTSAFGIFQGYQVITENPGLTQIIGTSVQPADNSSSTSNIGSISSSPFISSSSVSQSQYSGYEYYVSSGITTVGAYWSVPSVTYPNYTPYCNNGVNTNYVCSYEMWAGYSDLSIDNSNTHGVAQAGTLSNFTCANSTCSTGGTAKYNMFYVVGSPNTAAVYCTGTSISPGDTIDDNVTYSSGTAYIDIVDLSISSNNSCTAQLTQTYAPYYAQYLVELRYHVSTFPYYNPLASVTSNSGVTVVYDCTLNGSGISSTGYYAQYIMSNSGNTNNYPSSISKQQGLGDYFDQVYQGSQGT